MNRAIFGILLCVAPTILLAGKKPVEPPQTWPTSRTFTPSCDTVWPVALQVFVADGWAIKSSDRTGGILILEWARGEWAGTKSDINPVVRRHTIEKTAGIYTIWNGFRIMPATVIAAPTEAGCMYSITMVYHGQGGGFGAGEAWRVLRTNGYFEDQMLSEIAGRLPK